MNKITHGSILAVFFSANAFEIQEGEDWYARANLIARNIGNAYNVDWETVAGVIAALSPNNRWDRNVADTERLVKAYCAGGFDADAVKVCTFGNNKDKAIRILSGESPRDVLGGLKVQAFYGCIVGDNDVCVDGHAYSIWVGERIATSKTPKISPKLYHSIASDYRVATDQINAITGKQYLPSQVQAITWVVWRNQINGESS
jgi:hypothetical protein